MYTDVLVHVYEANSTLFSHFNNDFTVTALLPPLTLAADDNNAIAMMYVPEVYVCVCAARFNYRAVPLTCRV